MAFHIHLLKGVTGYRQLVQRLDAAVKNGSLSPGNRIPSQRQLAQKLGLAVGTITKAYQEAEKIGLIASYVGRGTFITHPGARLMGAKVTRAGVAIDLTVDAPLEHLAPDLASIALSWTRNPCGHLLEYDNPKVSLRHRQAGAAWIERFGLKVCADEVLVCAGSQNAILCALRAVCEPGDKIIAEELCYPGLKGAAQMLGLRTESAAMDADGVIPAAVESLCKSASPKALYLTPSLQNPTNSQLSKARRRQLVELAERYDLAIIEDGIRPKTVVPSPSPLATEGKDRTLFIAGVSKSLGGGFRVAYLVAPERWRRKVADTLWSSVYMASPLTAEMVSQLIESGAADEVIKRKECEAQRRRDLFEQHLGHLTIKTRAGSTTGWIDLPTEWSNIAAVTALRDRGIAVASSDAFWVGRTPPPNGIRVSLGAPADAQALEQALKIIAAVLSMPPGSTRL